MTFKYRSPHPGSSLGHPWIEEYKSGFAFGNWSLNHLWEIVIFNFLNLEHQTISHLVSNISTTRIPIGSNQELTIMLSTTFQTISPINRRTSTITSLRFWVGNPILVFSWKTRGALVGKTLLKPQLTLSIKPSVGEVPITSSSSFHLFILFLEF